MYAHIVFINFEHILCTNVLLSSNVESFYPTLKLLMKSALSLIF